MLEREGAFGVISAYRPLTKRENKLRHQQLIQDLQKLGYRRWEENKSQWTEDEKTTKEKSLLVPNIKPEDLYELGKKYGQEATIYKGGDGVIGMYYPGGKYAHVAVDPKGDAAFQISEGDALFSRPNRDWSYEFDFLWGEKVPWDGKHPLTRKQVRKHLQQVEQKAKAEAAGGEAPMETGEQAGEESTWDDFLKERYDGGKKKVPNTNKDTRDTYPEVTVNHLLKTDKDFSERLRREYKSWGGEARKASLRVASRWLLVNGVR